MSAVVLNPLTKSKLSYMAYSRWRQQILPIGVSQPPPRPARPLKPLLRLAELGFSYGDMPAHRECEKSSDNVASCLASIPLVQEARGRDAGPRLVQKLVGCGLKYCVEDCR